MERRNGPQLSAVARLAFMRIRVLAALQAPGDRRAALDVADRVPGAARLFLLAYPGALLAALELVVAHLLALAGLDGDRLGGCLLGGKEGGRCKPEHQGTGGGNHRAVHRSSLPRADKASGRVWPRCLRSD